MHTAWLPSADRISQAIIVFYGQRACQRDIPRVDDLIVTP